MFIKSLKSGSHSWGNSEAGALARLVWWLGQKVQANQTLGASGSLETQRRKRRKTAQGKLKIRGELQSDRDH